jgi:osmotically inducible protein OsmC
MSVLYTAEATAWGGREGRCASSDGAVDVQLRIPKEMGGPGGEGTTNPEQLFALGYAGCFHSALKLIARKEGVDVGESAITAKVGLCMLESGAFTIAVELEAELPGVEPEQARKLLDAAHQVCPYSNATRGNIDVSLTLHEE